jgi:serine/threonine protein kinase
VTDNSGILKIYGLSQDPNTKEYIIVLYYAEGGNFINWMNVNENFKYFSWKKKLRTLYFIARGLNEIHKKKMVHHDFHTGNILFNTSSMEEYVNRIYISDMGSCKKVYDNNQNKIYGVMPYVAPEVLRGKPYTQAADIYSFGMVMYFVATGRQPFDNCAHDHILALDICEGIRPELNESEVPQSYIDLMKECWNSNPNNRPNSTELYQSLWSIIMNSKSEIEKAENYRNKNLSSLIENRQTTTHPQAIYTSRLLNPFTKDLPKYDNKSECLDCAILD